MNQPTPVSSSTGKSTWRQALLVVTLIGATIVGILWWLSLPSAAEVAQDAKRSLRRSQFELAYDQSQEAIRLGQDTPEMRIVAGESAVRLKRFDEALEQFEKISDDSGREGLAARLSSASILIHEHQAGRAEDQLRRALAIEPGDEQAHRLMSECLGLQGRRWESIPHLVYGIQRGDINLQSLCYLADTDRTVELSEEQLAAFVASDCPRCWLGAACVAISYREFDKARELIRKCLAADSSIVEAHVRLGKLLLSDDSPIAMLNWETNLPDQADKHPGIWIIRSEWNLKTRDYRQAAACLLKALSIYPDHSAANHQMAHVLSLLDRAADGDKFRERGRKLTRLATLANEIYLGDTRSAPLQESAELVESLGRISEAIGWAVAAQYENPAEAWPVSMQRRLAQSVTADAPAESRRHLQAIADLQMPWTRPSSATDTTNSSRATVASASFQDVSKKLGINFRYENAEDLTTDGRLMFEYTGGGVGVIDLDHDGRPDLYFTQGGALPPGQKQTAATDALFRNRSGGNFTEVSQVAGITDYGFGQGVAAGDINNDGFTDLYVANIDGNRIYLNLGDGTFQDMTQSSQTGHPLWTTSLAIADLDLDAIPDLYDVTFLSDKDVFERVCEEDGVKRSCAPAGFSAADDFIYLGSGDGTFRDVSESAGIRVPDGDGLGIVVADFAGNGQPSVFIANDGRANFYFSRSPDVDEFGFQEQALTSGLAFDRDGRAQACMGVASSDFDGDGTWDLFVTNFFNESNTLYSQFGSEVFGDNSQAARIREASLGMLGFGTQAVDADLDGFEDLLVANGHVDNFEYKGIAYRMPLEFFHNLSGRGFEKTNAEVAGEIFQRPMLGRSMAIIDWNLDGRAEVAVSRLEDESLLLQNTTSTAGHYLAVEIAGIQSARDATTARLVATVGNRQFVRQFTAGDGYQSSNQKQIIFGLGDSDVVDKLEITWPGGKTQVFQELAADKLIMLREDDSRIWPLPR